MIQDYDDEEDEIELEIVEVTELEEPVPTQDSCLQVTEEDIAFCMGECENPLPEVDQEGGGGGGGHHEEEHPLRILSQENLTVVSTFTGEELIYLFLTNNKILFIIIIIICFVRFFIRYHGFRKMSSETSLRSSIVIRSTVLSERSLRSRRIHRTLNEKSQFGKGNDQSIDRTSQFLQIQNITKSII